MYHKNKFLHTERNMMNHKNLIKLMITSGALIAIGILSFRYLHRYYGNNVQVQYVNRNIE